MKHEKESHNERYAMTLFDCGFKPLQDKLDIGFQYYGSKNKVTPWLFSEFYKYQPNAVYFFDLFGGGGSVSFAGVASGLKVTYNELKSDMPRIWQYVLDCIAKPKSDIGIFDKDLYRFCDREQFFSIRDKFNNKEDLSPQDLIRRYIYSFNCAGGQYLCSEWKAKFKNALHNMVISPYFSDIDYKSAIRIFLDYLCNELGNDERILENILLDFCENPKLTRKTIWERRSDSTKAIIALEAICIAQLLHLFKDFDFAKIRDYSKRDICLMIDKYKPDLPKKEYKGSKVKGLSECKALQKCERLERLERLEQLQQLQQLQRLERLKLLKSELNHNPLVIKNLSYADYDFKAISKDLSINPSEIIIYCDIPYKGTCTEGYHGNKGDENSFDYDAFCEWALRQTQNGFNVFVSEWQTPCENLFKEISSKERGIALQKGKSDRDMVLEKLFLAIAKK